LRELRRIPIENREVLLRRRELVHRDGHHVVVQVVLDLLVEVVADAGAMREEVLDRHVVADEREVTPQQRPRGRRQLENAFRDEADHGERRQTLRSARDRELRRDVVRDLVAAVCEPVRLRHFDSVPAVDPDHAGEGGVRGDPIELVVEHMDSLPRPRSIGA
jgi:hypothetical protein